MTTRGQGPDGRDRRPSAEQLRHQQYEDDLNEAAERADSLRAAAVGARDHGDWLAAADRLQQAKKAAAAAEPVVAVDPTVPADVQKAITKAYRRASRSTTAAVARYGLGPFDEPPPPTLYPSTRTQLPELEGRSIEWGRMTLPAIGTGTFTAVTAAYAAVHASTAGGAIWFLAGVPVAILTAGSVFTALVGWEPSNKKVARLAQQQVHEVHGRYILPSELADDEARAMLGRAQAAAAAVESSAVNRADLIDRQRNSLSLPDQVWAVARGLVTHSRLTGQQPAEPRSAQVAELAERRADSLAAALQGIERRVEALEDYAAQVAEADARYAEWRQVEELTTGSDEVLDFLAATAADDLAVAELAGLTGQAAAVAAAFRTALESARAAGIRALPEGEAAA